MIPLEHARSRVLAGIEPFTPERVRLWHALGLVLAEDVVAPGDVPPFANSAMDGYAVRAADTERVPVVLPVVEDLAAGHVASAVLEAGTAIKIMTGAPLPEGADAVVPVEDTEQQGEAVRVLAPVVAGSSVREAGGDVRAGATVFTAGTRLTPPHLGVLSAVGVAAPLVRRRPRVGIMSTGDEVRPPETNRLLPGQIRDANRPLLGGLLADLGVETHDYGIVADDAGRLRATLRRAAAETDAVLTSGGVSMGDYDLVKQIVTELGDVALWKVAMQPAKPFAYGRIDGTPFFGLPGNPVSVLVAFEQFARPALLTMMGARRILRPRVTGRAAVSFATPEDKTAFIRVNARWVDGGWFVEPSGGQASNVLSAAAQADAFAVIPVGVGRVAEGDVVTLEMFRWPEDRRSEDSVDG